MQSNEIRQRFLEYFAVQGHTVVPSSSLVPAGDPTLLFTNAGMVQFKDVFLGHDLRPYTRAASSQRCVRAGGKHNDLENVGYTARHHTFFEMLGNFSFGDYFKHDAIHFAWELLTQVYQLPPEKLWITVYYTDDSAYEIWTQEIKVPAERIARIGDKPGGPRYASDNFWQMGETGPCGPCSEIFYDHGSHIAGGPPGSSNGQGDRYIEIWNLVFMQFDRQKNGNDYVLNPLPKPSVDTGMGLERIAAVLQGVHSNYDIDLFRDLIKSAARETETKDLSNNSLKVIADHIRACSFLIVDGVIPSNEGRGYVLRRIIRRAVRHGYKLGQKRPFFYKLVPDLVKTMGTAYPELPRNAERVVQILHQEEERFAETLENGMAVLEWALQSEDRMLSGDVVFKLYDTYGFPLDLTADIARERGVTVDFAGFEAAMEQQRERARAASKFGVPIGLEYRGGKTEFRGYEFLALDAQVVAIYKEGTSVQNIKANDHAVVVLDKTPFYAEAGGQVGDAGELIAENGTFSVGDTQKIQSDVFGHHGKLTTGVLAIGDRVSANVDTARRSHTMRNHSATHLMHSALREILGSHVEQKGSLVDAEKTRFDFSHDKALSSTEIHRVEALVNAEILKNEVTTVRIMKHEDAIRAGAMALFGEKYGDEVRVLDIGSSRELCGGTHIKRTGEIGFFKIIAESGVAAGIRRIEAITGEAALVWVQRQEETLQHAAETLKTPVQELTQKVQQTMDNVKNLEKELSRLKSKFVSTQGNDLAMQAIDIRGIKVVAAILDGADARALREAADKLRERLKRAVLVLGSNDGNKVTLIAAVTSELTAQLKAGDLVNFVAQQVGGKGGGRADMAQAGGSEPANLPAALASVKKWIEERL